MLILSKFNILGTRNADHKIIMLKVKHTKCNRRYPNDVTEFNFITNLE